MNVGKIKVIRCSRYGNGGRMHAILNRQPLEEVDYFKYLGSQVAAEGECEREAARQYAKVRKEWRPLVHM